MEILWFVLIGVLWTGFFFLEGFDFGVGMLVPWLGREDRERRALINTIGPHWDGNEVWLLTAGGATFAAFPHWYATLFSALYMPFTVLLLSLILRGVSFEFRSRLESARWRSFWDWSLCLGSALPALLVGVAMTLLLVGLPLDGQGHFVGTWSDWLHPLGLLGGLSSLFLFLHHGSAFLGLKLEGDLKAALERWERPLHLAALSACTLFVLALLVWVPGLRSEPWWFYVLGGGSWLALALSGLMQRQQNSGWAFFSTSLSIAGGSASLFVALFPRVMVSSLYPEYSLTLYNAASTPYTLKVMSVVALCFVPLVLGYQAYTYWVFRKRISPRDKLVY